MEHTDSTVLRGPTLDSYDESAGELTSVDIRPRAPATSVRTTILPRIERHGDLPVLVHPDHLRYEEQRSLGRGGVGEVTLVNDNDIHRQVALKRLRGGAGTTDAIIRFVEEIRTIGQLEHPGIVPIHDVGVDERGHYYFIMKYAQGETLEQIITRLAAGDEEYLRRYTIERRVQLFVQVLHAIEFAHARGIIHRDLKPANIMVGAYGEVMVMDWGLAKQIRKQAPAAPAAPVIPEGGGEVAETLPAAALSAAPAAPEAPPGERQRLFTTQIGALLGTPAYMSPEQAAGKNEQLDERSDIYSLCVVLHELLTLRHYMAQHETMHTMIYSVLHEPVDIPYGGGLPTDLVYLLRRGLSKDPAQRFSSVAELLAELNQFTDGCTQVRCPFSGMRRTGQEFLHFGNAHPVLALFIFLSVFSLALYGAVGIAGRVARLLAG